MSTPAPPTPRSPALVVITLSLCGIVVSLQQTLILPLLPLLPDLLDTSPDTASWLVTATLLSGAVATPTLSRLADMYGKKRMMVVALGVSILGSALGAVSQALPLLVAARALQGVGMALVPVGIAIMRDELPRDRIPLGVALMSATLAIGAGIGPPASGLITEHLDWHSIFWLTGLVGVALLTTAHLVLPESRVRTNGTFDLRGAVLLSAALTAILLGLSKGAQWGWTSPPTLVAFVLGAAILAVWTPLELRTPNPLVDLKVATRRAVVLVNGASVLIGFAMFANMLLTVQLLQAPAESGYGLGIGPMEAGFWMAPSAVAFGVTAPVAARMIRIIGPQRTLLVGTVMMTIAYAARVYLSDDLAQVVTGSVVVSVGTAIGYSALPTLIMRAVPVTETASANGLNVLLRSVGTSTASAAVAAVFSATAVTVAGHAVPPIGAIDALFWLSALATLGAIAVTWPTLRMKDFAPEADRAGTDSTGRPCLVVHGTVVTAEGAPVTNAVVTILTADGQPVDWGQADSEGQFAAAIPGPGDYLIVTAAEGWQPRTRQVTIDGDHALPPLVLRDRLTLRGTITDGEGRPVTGALVILTRLTGEAVTTTHTGHDGRYEVPRPANGRYVLSAVAPDGAVGARPVAVLDASRHVDLALGTPLA